jgi:NAD(P)-dependent dehydrogenase (short-subunit alcohol dehydrogenase family)
MSPAARNAFDGTTAVVTGASSGVGAASARRLAEDGASVVLVDIDERGAELAESLGGRFVRLDVSDADAWDSFADDLRGEGGVHYAHLNAGILAAPEPEKFVDTSTERARTMVGVNLFGVLFGIHALAPAIIETGGGAIVATASVAGLLPYGGDPVYAATKHAVVGLVTSVAPQLGRAGVRVHAICPGGIDTPMVTERQKGEMAGQQRSMLHPSEVADAVAALLLREEGGVVQTITKEAGVRPVDVAVTLG